MDFHNEETSHVIISFTDILVTEEHPLHTPAIKVKPLALAADIFKQIIADGI